MKVPDTNLSWNPRSYDLVKALSPTRIAWNGSNELTQVCSTQYLGMLWVPEFAKAIQQLVRSESTFGSLGSNYLGGTHEARLELEQMCTTISGSEDCVAFPSGWTANFAVCELIGSRYDIVFSEKHNHNSILRGLRDCKAKLQVVDLQRDDFPDLLKNVNRSAAALIAPMVHGLTGERLPAIPEHISLEEVLFVLDECHSFGVLGRSGFGCPYNRKPDVRILGFSKALGSVGAVVCGPGWFINLLRQVGSPFIFSTAPPPIFWKLNACSLEISRRMDSEREWIQVLAQALRTNATSRGLHVSGDTHVSAIQLPPHASAARFEKCFRDHGYYIKVSEFPSRPQGEACARVAFNPFHTVENANSVAEIAARAIEAATITPASQGC